MGIYFCEFVLLYLERARKLIALQKKLKNKNKNFFMPNNRYPFEQTNKKNCLEWK